LTPLIVVQARSGSTRLPGKVLRPLAGAPLLQRMLERVLATPGAIDLVVATTTDAEDEPVRMLCRQIDVRCFSGHPTDLLDRHVQAAREVGAEVVVKIPSDCPLIDPSVIRRVLDAFAANADRYDFVSNIHPPSYPDGHDVEVMPMSVLEQAWREATQPFEREHTTPFIWDQPQRFRLGNVVWESGLDYSRTHRWTIDYPEDYAFIAAVYDALWSERRPIFSLPDILALLDVQPELAQTNARYCGVNWYRHHLGLLKTVSEADTRQPTD